MPELGCGQAELCRAEASSEQFFRLGKDLVGRGSGINLDNLANLLVVVDDRHAGVDESAEALADALGVVVGSAAGLASLEETGLHDLFGAIVEQNQLGGADGLFKLVSLVHLAREAINEEATLLAAALLQSLGHGVLKKLNSNFHRDNETVLNVVADQVTELGARALLLGTEQVTSRQVSEAMLLDQSGALRALSSAGTTEHKQHRDVLGAEGRRGLLGSSQLARRARSSHAEPGACFTSPLALVYKEDVSSGSHGNDGDEGPELDLVGSSTGFGRIESRLLLASSKSGSACAGCRFGRRECAAGHLSSNTGERRAESHCEVLVGGENGIKKE